MIRTRKNTVLLVAALAVVLITALVVPFVAVGTASAESFEMNVKHILDNPAYDDFKCTVFASATDDGNYDQWIVNFDAYKSTGIKRFDVVDLINIDNKLRMVIYYPFVWQYGHSGERYIDGIGYTLDVLAFVVENPEKNIRSYFGTFYVVVDDRDAPTKIGVVAAYSTNVTWLASYYEGVNVCLMFDYVMPAGYSQLAIEHVNDRLSVYDAVAGDEAYLYNFAMAIGNYNLLPNVSAFGDNKYNDGYKSGSTIGYNNGYKNGYSDGFKAGDVSNLAGNQLANVIPSTLGAIGDFFKTVLSFNVFGISLFSIVGTVGAILLLLWLVKIVKGG